MAFDSQLFLVVLITVCSFNLCRSTFSTNGSDPFVHLPNLGTLRGSFKTSAFTGRTVHQFLSIKYGENTAGDFRFKAPRKALPWEGVRDVSRYGLPCPQLKLMSLFPSTPSYDPDLEDCLTLSVFSNQLTGRKPVMFFIHGGAFFEGSGAEYTPEYLLEKDIVLVVVQYRLGPLGFLALLNEAMPGNAGLLDIKLALEWVRDNIEAFGGDPQMVTVFGQSAGAAAVSALMYSPVVPEGLFHRAIMQSGVSSSAKFWDNDPVGHVIEIASIAGCTLQSENPEENSIPSKAANCLQHMDVWHLLRSFKEHKLNTSLEKGLAEGGGDRLTVGDFHGFMPEKSINLAKSGRVRRNVGVMAGVMKNDGTYLLRTVYDLLKPQGLLDDHNFVRFSLLDAVNKMFGVDDSTGSMAGYEILSLFDPEELASGKFENLTDGLSDLVGSIFIKAPLLREVQASARVNNESTFLYSFDYKGEKTRFGYGANTSHYPFKGGVHHSDDLLYLFPYPPGEPTLNEKDAEMSRLMVDLWTSFAITGVPYSTRLSCTNWPAVTDYAGPYLHIDEHSYVGSNFYEEFSVASRERHRTGTTTLRNKRNFSP